MVIHRPRKRPLSRYQRDARIGYGALGVSAVAFVMVLVASFVVIKVAPDLDLGVPSALAPAQAIVKHPALTPVAARTSPGQDDDRPEADPAVVPAATDDQAPATPGVTDPGPVDPVEPGPVDPEPIDPEPVDPGPVDPGPGPDRPGPASALVDPVVEGLTGTLDQVTGGATQPVTGPVGGLTDDVTDAVDGLVGGLAGGLLGTP